MHCCVHKEGSQILGGLYYIEKYVIVCETRSKNLYELRENTRHFILSQTQSFIVITIPGGCTRKHAGSQAQTTTYISAKRSYLQ